MADSDDQDYEIDRSDLEPDFRSSLERLVNRFSKESQSNTPDFILAEYLDDCLRAFDNACVRREHWYGHRHEPAGVVIPVDGPPPVQTDDGREAVLLVDEVRWPGRARGDSE